MLNCTLNQREYQYQNLNNFTNQVYQEIVDITSNLGWTVESIETDNDNRLVCLYNSSHRIGKKMLDQHLESCKWKKEGYSELDVPLSEPSLPSGSPSSIKFDVSLQNSILQEARKVDPTMKFGMGERIIPQTSDRIFSDFTGDERKVLYKYIVSNTIQTNTGYDITDTRRSRHPDEKEDKKLSFIELLAQERNLKRRRAKHRGVHTNKKSHTEILREVINQQMELYTDCMTEIQSINYDTKPTDKHLDNAVQNSFSSSNSPLKYDTSFGENSEDYHCRSSKSRYDKAYKQPSATLQSKNREKREKWSRSTMTATRTTKTTESWRQEKSCKRRRSRSRERDYNKRNKHWSMRQSYKTNNMKLCEIEKSVTSNCYSKDSSDRR